MLKEIAARLGFMVNVGLDYLTLDRTALTLSGGEAQRIRLATQIGSQLMGVLYILDEPSIGLHQRDNARLIETLKGMRDLGNTVLVVEHDEDTIRAADWVVDMGPGAGEHGGHVVCSARRTSSSTARTASPRKYLRGERRIAVPAERREGNGKYLVIRGAAENNLKDVDVRIPLGKFVAVTGVSGSGKSTLVVEVLYKRLAQLMYRAKDRPGTHDAIEGHRAHRQGDRHRPEPHRPHAAQQPCHLCGPLHRHARPLRHAARGEGARLQGRALLASTSRAGAARPARATASSASRCSSCPMSMCPAKSARATATTARRWRSSFRGKSIADVLEMTVEEGLEFFQNIPRIRNKLETLNAVGLGYVKLGQPATTLSGGEAQRIKLSKELSRRATGNTLYILDEPTTGLHFEDVRKLLEVLHELVNKGNTVLVIEHNLDVIKNCDWLIDMGPEGGNKGGYVIAEGTPEHIAEIPKSYTGQFLRPMVYEENYTPARA